MLEQTRLMQDEAIQEIKMFLEYAMNRFDVLPEDDEELNGAWQAIKEAQKYMEDV